MSWLSHQLLFLAAILFLLAFEKYQCGHFQPENTKTQSVRADVFWIDISHYRTPANTGLRSWSRAFCNSLSFLSLSLYVSVSHLLLSFTHPSVILTHSVTKAQNWRRGETPSMHSIVSNGLIFLHCPHNTHLHSTQLLINNAGETFKAHSPLTTEPNSFAHM